MLTPEEIKKLDEAGIGSSKSMPVASSARSLSDRLGIADEKPDTHSGVINHIKDFGIGVAKGVGSTVTGLGTLTAKGLGHVLPGKAGEFFEHGAQEGEHLMDTTFKADGGAQQAGKALEQIAEFFIPASKIATVEKLLASGAKAGTVAKLIPIVGEKAAQKIGAAAALGTKIGVRAGEGGGIVAIQSGGDTGETGTAALVSGAIPAAGAVLKPFAKPAAEFGKSVAKGVAGALSGRGTAVIDEIVKDPRTALQALSGKSMDVLEKDAHTLKEAVVGMKHAAGKEHTRVINNLEEIFQNEGKSFSKAEEIQKIDDTLAEEFGIVKDEKGKFDFNQTRFQDKEGKIIERAINMVENYKGPLTPKTIDMLASKIEKLKSSSPSAIETNSAVHTVINSLRDSIAKMGESVGYQEGADVARNYARAMDKIENFTGLFKATADDYRPRASLGTEGTAEVARKGPIILPDVEKTKIINDLQTLFSGNKDVDKDVLRKMFGGQEILTRQASRTLVTAQEKASSKIASFLREALISPILSPKRIGQWAARLSIAKEKIPPFIEKLKRLDPAARAALIEAFSRETD